MTLTVTHSTTVTKPNDSEYDVSADAWNEAHQITGTLPVADLDASSLTNNRLIYTASGLLSSTSLLAYATSGHILTVMAGAATDVPLTVKGATGQSGNLQEWQNSAGTALAFVSAGGTVTTRAASASSYNAFEFRDSGNIPRAWVDITGQAGTIVISDVYNTRYAGVGTAPSSAAQAQIVTDSATRKALTVKGASAQTANLTEWQNSAGTVLASVNAAGNGAFVNLTSIPQQAGYSANDISLFTTHFRQSPNGIDLRISEPSSSFNGKVFGYSSGRIGYGTGNLSAGLLDSKMEFRGTQVFIDALNANAVRFTENDASNNNYLSLYHDSSSADTDRFYIHTAKIANVSFRPHLELGGRTFSLRTGLNGNVPTSNAITFSVSEDGAALLQPSTASTVPLSMRGAASHTANLTEWQNNSGTALASVDKNGGFAPASMSDATAVNGTQYYSTTANKLVFKDSSGTVNALYGSVVSGLATVTLSDNAFEHEQTVSASGVTSGSRILLSLAPASDDDENDPEMLDIASIVGIPGTNQITVRLTFDEPQSGTIKLNYMAM